MQNFKEIQSRTGGFSPESPDSDALSGEQLVARWSSLPAALRYPILRNTGEQLRRYHHSGASLLDVNLRQSHYNPETRQVCLWPPPSSRSHFRLFHFHQLRLLAQDRDYSQNQLLIERPLCPPKKKRNKQEQPDFPK